MKRKEKEKEKEKEMELEKEEKIDAINKGEKWEKMSEKNNQWLFQVDLSNCAHVKRFLLQIFAIICL